MQGEADTSYRTLGDVPGPPRIIVLIPVYNDWDAAWTLVGRLRETFQEQAVRLDVLLVDDGSTEAPPPLDVSATSPIDRIDILPLKRNMGHQRAIALGLCHIQMERPCDAVLVMDADGEDDPADASRLVSRFLETPSRPIVFAERTRRSESLTFRCCYLLYRCLHRALTGHGIRFGNFSLLPFGMLEGMVTSPDLWNNYAASILKMRLPYVAIPTHRARRYCGQSRMNFPGLVLHGLGAISVFAETVGVRLLLAAAAVAVGIPMLLGLIVTIRLTTTLAVPGWATYAGGLALVMLVQLAIAAFLVVLFILNARNNVNPGPIREYHALVRPVYRLHVKR